VALSEQDFSENPVKSRRLQAGTETPENGETTLSLSHVCINSSERPEIEAFLNGIYTEKYGATISSHYPHFLCARNRVGQICAVIGFRFLRHHDAFLQQYLDEPVEKAVARVLGKPIARMQIVEMGSFASTGVGVVGLFSELARHLQASGASYAVATSTRRLQRCFRSLGMETRSIAPADPSRLPDGGASWGTYYGTNPEVVAGEITTAFARLTTCIPGGARLSQSAETAA
tara:strand:- start:80071 stop:80763 length:693 start_codon:yes stop_codon:yes gene_type:complete